MFLCLWRDIKWNFSPIYTSVCKSMHPFKLWIVDGLTTVLTLTRNNGTLNIDSLLVQAPQLAARAAYLPSSAQETLLNSTNCRLVNFESPYIEREYRVEKKRFLSRARQTTRSRTRRIIWSLSPIVAAAVTRL